MIATISDTESYLEKAVLQLFGSLGWETINAYDETDGDTTLLGRRHQNEVVLKRYLRRMLKQFNQDIHNEGINQAIEIITRDRSAMDITSANRAVYTLFKNGIKVTYVGEDGSRVTDRVQVIDWKEPENNHFLLVSQFWINGTMYRRRPDLVGFVNGIPLIMIELKAPDKSVYHAYHDNLRDYKDTIPRLFWYNAFTILSNGTEAKLGGATADWEHFNDWKKINDEGEEGVISLDTIIRGTCEKKRFIDILENFIFFLEARGGLIKIVCKNHQYLGVNNVIREVDQIHENRGRLGVFWHTQGSGKSASMIYFTQKVLRKISGNWSFVIVTDRQELDDQIYRYFRNADIIHEEKTQATSSYNLRQLLGEDHRYIFTLIHKFRTENGDKHPVLSERSDIIVITDEAHRSQYDILARNMRDALPNASFIGFTGTPLIKTAEERTKEVFGDYVSIYNFSQSIADKATVPLYYENRVPGVQLGNEDLNEEMNRLLDEAMLDEEQEKKLEREFGRQYHIITRDDRLDTIAEDLVAHFMERGFPGKAMVISIDKATAIKSYDKVQKHWQHYLEGLKDNLQKLMQKPIQGDDSGYNQERQEKILDLEQKIRFMESTDMAVVVSQAQNEIDDMKKRGLNILPHRQRMVNEDLDTKFKDPDNPFRIVFVCAMWITGFDVPCCSTMYLDKPMQNHTLMQTIARANRVFGEKSNGLIVDYVGIFNNLKKALAIYAQPAGDRIDLPIKDKKELRKLLDEAIDNTLKFLSNLDINLSTIIAETDVFHRTKLKEDAVNGILLNDDTKKEYLKLADEVKRYHKAYLPDPVDSQTGQIIYIVRKLADRIREIIPPDISDIMSKVENLLDRSIQSFTSKEPSGDFGSKIYDLSQIDVGKLRERFDRGRKRIELEMLRAAIERKIHELVRVNRSRMDYLEKFKQMIDDYNDGVRSIEAIFEEWLQFSSELGEEEKRYIREELENEEELAIFDILTKPDPKLSSKERRQVKRIAHELLQTLKTEKFVLDWKKRQQTLASVKLTIEEVLDQLPEVYSTDLFTDKCNLVYGYVWDRF